jgi:type II secretory pathway component PulC
MFANSLLSLRKGDKISCKYPKHGRRNILKRHEGTVVSISNDGVVVEKNGKESTVDFKQVEQQLSKE